MNSFFTPPLRPPGACAEKAFSTLCVRCGKCVEVCPHDSIKLLLSFGKDNLTPYIDVSDKPCHLCMKCPPVCPTGALDPGLEDLNSVKMGQAHILKDKCHNFTDGVMCMTCYDRCPIRGRGIVLDFGITPTMTRDCAGCGVCVYVCPESAIVINPRGYDYTPPNALALAEK